MTDNTPTVVGFEGWADGGRRWHYFSGCVSLCGQALMFERPAVVSSNERTNPRSCKACKRRLLARQQK